LDRQLFHGLIAVACWLPLAGQTPSTDLPPKTIFGVYGASRKTGGDSIRVTRAAQGKIALALKLYYANGHTCALNKDAEWHGDHLLLATEGISENEPCKLEAAFPSGRIVLKDEGQRCARVYCGTRGKLDGVSLPKKSSAQK
jgi:hypothetical protein